MISGVLFVRLGESMLTASLPLFYWFVIFGIINAVYIPLLEEPGLVNSFGGEYRTYKRNVPRWIPRLTPWENRMSPKAVRRTRRRRRLSSSIPECPVEELEEPERVLGLGSDPDLRLGGHGAPPYSWAIRWPDYGARTDSCTLTESKFFILKIFTKYARMIDAQ